MLQVLNKETQSLLLTFNWLALGLILSKYLFIGYGISRIETKIIAALHLSQQTNTCSKSATETLEIIEDNSNEKTLKKKSPKVFCKKMFLNNS